MSAKSGGDICQLVRDCYRRDQLYRHRPAAYSDHCLMAIWMGENGGIRLERSEAGPFYVGINPSDVDTGAKRFSFDRANTALITGDEVSFIRVDENGQQSSELLDFVAASAWEDGQQHSDGQWYVSVDPVGGIRLYESWREAVSRSAGSSLSLLSLRFLSVSCRGPLWPRALFSADDELGAKYQPRRC